MVRLEKVRNDWKSLEVIFLSTYTRWESVRACVCCTLTPVRAHLHVPGQKWRQKLKAGGVGNQRVGKGPHLHRAKKEPKPRERLRLVIGLSDYIIIYLIYIFILILRNNWITFSESYIKSSYPVDYYVICDNFLYFTHLFFNVFKMTTTDIFS